jgi:putative membrane protein
MGDVIGALQAALAAFVAGFPVYVLQVAVASVMIVAASAVYVLLSPYRELEMMRAGNASAGLAFSGVVLGLTIPIAAALGTAHNIFDLVIWGIVALLMQLLAFRVADLILKDLPKRIANEEAGAAIVTLAVKLASGIVLAAGMMDPHIRF